MIEKSYTDEESAAIVLKHGLPRSPKIALLREDVRGLDAAPLQYIVGYAFARVECEGACERTLCVETHSGVKVYVNGNLVLNDHAHTDSADDNSTLLAKARIKRLVGKVALIKGENRILVKCDADYGSMTVRVCLNK